MFKCVYDQEEATLLYEAGLLWFDGNDYANSKDRGPQDDSRWWSCLALMVDSKEFYGLKWQSPATAWGESLHYYIRVE